MHSVELNSRIIFFANTDWYLYNFRLALLRAAAKAGYKVSCVSPPGAYGDKFRAEGFEWQTLPFERNSPLGMLVSLWRTRRALRQRIDETQPLIVHSFTLTSILLTWLAVPARSPVRRINAVTGLGFAFTGRTWRHGLLRRLLKPFLRLALGGAQALTVVQNACDRDFLIGEFGLPHERVRLVAGSGVDIERFQPGARGDGAGLRVGFVGRLLTDKGIVEFIEAARTLISNDVDGEFGHVTFVVAGSADPGNPAAVPESDLARWSADGRIEFVGHEADMPKFLNSLDVFVLPSYREGLSRSLIEAGACGLPAVTTRVPGCRDVISDGENGLLVEPGEVPALRAAIERLLRDAHLRQRLGRRAREVIVERFADGVVNGQTLGLYEEWDKGLKGEGAKGRKGQAQGSRRKAQG